ncbi:MAG: flagellar biosynthesis anti-sigma factor FlgM [Desulfosoma sp.]
MDIKKVGSYMATTAHVQENRPVRPEEQPAQVSKNLEADGVEDRVQFSREAVELARTRVMMDREDIRTEKVEALRQKIHDGTYKVDPQKIAARMLDEII